MIRVSNQTLEGQTLCIVMRKLLIAEVVLLLSGVVFGVAAVGEEVAPIPQEYVEFLAKVDTEPTEVTHAETMNSPCVPSWAHEAVFYQIFPERFENGDPSNDPTRESLVDPERVPSTWKPTPWTSDWFERQPWEVEMGSSSYRRGVLDRRYGGDLQGILDRLDYLRTLGVNALYLNPIFYARSLHKYDGSSFHHVDPYFGPDPAGDLALIHAESLDPATWQLTAADRLFLELISQAHRRDIRIVIDGVFNHTGRDFPAFVDLRERQADSPFKDWYVVQSFDDAGTTENEFQYVGWWGFRSLPEFSRNRNGDSLSSGPRDYVFAISKRWMDPDGDGDPGDGIDGWRLDVATEVPVEFWKEWNRYIRTINPQCYTVAESWEDAAEFLEEGGFSATMNYYGFAYPVKGFFIDGKLTASEFLETLAQRRDRYPVDRRYALQNLIDSHDTPRVASMIVNPHQGDYRRPERCDYDVRDRRQPEYKDRKPSFEERQLQRMIALFQIVYVGTPLFYYGTETGMWSGDDPSNRMPMVWADKSYAPQTYGLRGNQRKPDPVEFDVDLNKFYRSACSLRRYLPALQTGDIETINSMDDAEAFVIRRWDNRHSVYAAFNCGDKAYQWELENSGGSPPVEIFTASGQSHAIVITVEGDSVRVTVPPHEAVVLLQRLQQP